MQNGRENNLRGTGSSRSDVGTALLDKVQRRPGKQEDQLFRAWKSYDWDALDKLSEEEFTLDRHGNKGLYLTDEGVARAKEILESLGIKDWEKKPR